MKKHIFKMVLVSLSILFTGCLDDDKNPLDPSGSKNILEFMDIASPASSPTAVYPLYVVAFSVSPEAEFNAVLSYSGPNSNSKDIEVTLEVDPLMVDEYNEQNGTNYVSLPEELFDMASMTVTIPKGKTRVEVPITIYPDQFDLSINYALPLRMVSSSSGTISKNFSAVMFGTVVKNRYDGLYEVDGTLVDALGAFSGFYPTHVELRTVDGNTTSRYDVDLGTNLHGIIQISDGGLFVFGNFSIAFNFDDSNTGDLSDPIASAYNTIADPAPRSRSGKLGTGTNTFYFNEDGTPDRMEVVYIMMQSGADRATFTETWTYIGPR